MYFSHGIDKGKIFEISWCCWYHVWYVIKFGSFASSIMSGFSFSYVYQHTMYLHVPSQLQEYFLFAWIFVIITEHMMFCTYLIVFFSSSSSSSFFFGIIEHLLCLFFCLIMFNSVLRCVRNQWARYLSDVMFLSHS